MNLKLCPTLVIIAFLIYIFHLSTPQYASAAPKGTIAFDSDRNSKPPHDGASTTVYLIDANGSNERKWLEDPQASFGRLAWSPDGKQVAFHLGMVGARQIFIIDLPRGRRRNVTKSVGWSGRFGSPAWSPDGKWLAFSFRNPGVGAVPDIFVMETAGNKVEQLTHHPGNDAAPSWSPDAEKIAFLSSRDGNAEIYVMNRDGGQKRNLTNHPASDARPAWSPDGQKIAFYSDRENSQDDIYVMNADGTNVVNLTRHPAEDRLPAWSPDGKWIAFRSARARDWGWEIYVIDANGGNQTQVTKTLFAHNGSPSWVIGEPPVRGNPQAVNPLDKLPTFWGRLKSETR